MNPLKMNAMIKTATRTVRNFRIDLFSPSFSQRPIKSTKILMIPISSKRVNAINEAWSALKTGAMKPVRNELKNFPQMKMRL